MSEASLSIEAVCSALQVDAWGLDRLIGLGELTPQEDGRFSASQVRHITTQREARRREALLDLGALDGPHMGQTP